MLCGEQNSFPFFVFVSCILLYCAAEFLRLAELPCLVDLVFVGNPLEEKHSAEGTWMEEASRRLPRLKKLDGKCLSLQFQGS